MYKNLGYKIIGISIIMLKKHVKTYGRLSMMIKKRMNSCAFRSSCSKALCFYMAFEHDDQKACEFIRFSIIMLKSLMLSYGVQDFVHCSSMYPTHPYGKPKVLGGSSGLHCM